MRATPTEPRPEKKIDDYTTEQAKDEDPDVLARAIARDGESRMMAHDFADTTLESMSELSVRVWQRLDRISPATHAQIREKLMDIARDIEILLDLGEHDDEIRAQILLMFLMLPRDDDDGDGETAPAPEPSDAVPA